MFSKKEMRLFLPPHAPFTYVSFFIMSFPKCLPRCSFSHPDAEASVEMWFCQIVLPPGTALALKAASIQLGEWHSGKSRRQEDLVNQPRWVCYSRRSALRGDTQGDLRMHIPNKQPKWSSFWISHISQTKANRTLGFYRALAYGGKLLPLHFVEGR